MYKRESGGKGRNTGDKKPFVKTTAAKRTSSDTRGGKSYDKPAGKGFGNKKTYGDDKPAGRSYGDRKPSGPRSNFRDRDDSKSFDKAPRKTRSYGDDKPSGRSFSDRKPSGPRSNFRDRDDSKSFDKAPRKTRSYGDDKPSGRSFSDRKPSGPRSNFRDRDDSKSFDKAPRKTRSYGDDKPSGRSFSDRKTSAPRSNFRDRDDSKSFDKAPRKTRSYGDDKPSGRSFSDRKTSAPRSNFRDREDSKSFDKTPRSSEGKSRSGRGPRKQDVLAERKKAQKDETPQKGDVRLNRFIANAGICSRREADELIMAGLVKVNGVIIQEMGYQVKPTDEVRYNDERLTREKKVYILLNKPKDAITTSEDPEGRRTVMQLFGNDLGERIYPVGRLDRNTTGVLLFTNDGDLAQRLMHPKYEMKKVYKATLNKTFKGEDMWQLTNGVELEDGFIKPDAVAYPDAKNKAEVGVEIHSGKNHIIHRIFESLGYKVDKLDRALYAGLTKGKLKRGEWRELTEKEVAALKRTVKLA